MTDVLVLADGANPLGPVSSSTQLLQLTTVGVNPNVRLDANVYRTKFLYELTPRLEDLLRIASFIYAADTRISRGSAKDVFGDGWSRKFRFVIPVWDTQFWNTDTVIDSLRETLNFLAEDDFHFDFIPRNDSQTKQRVFQFKDQMDSQTLEDTVVMFSGGLDSLAATIQAYETGLRPVLVSHRPAPQISSRQESLVRELRQRFPKWKFPHISLWVNRVGGRRAIEFTQRSRSFLFTALGAATATLLEIDKLLLCDNGIVSINLPRSGQNYGATLSRSTHPHFIELVQNLMRLVTERPILTIENRLLFKTKREVVELIAASGHPELIQETVSCAHVEAKTNHQPHCGNCTQCIDRRFATVAAGMKEHDLPERYEKDIFTDVLPEGDARTHAENYIRFAAEVERKDSADSFFNSYPELFDCIPQDTDADSFGQQIFDLFQRHQRTVNEVVEQQIGRYSKDIRLGSLPKDSLLRMVINGDHTSDLRVRYIERLRSLLCDNLPANFQSQKAKNEIHVQDAGQAILQAARESLYREAPQIPFGVITTKPDFSDLSPNEKALFVEFKFPQSRPRLNAVNTEMTSRITIYKAQGAWILFIVYDPNRAIRDDEKFIRTFQEFEGVWVGISR